VIADYSYSAYITQPPETLDDEIIKNLLNSRYSSEALDVLHQCRIAIFDMMVHSSSTHEELIALNLSELWNKLIVKVSLMSGLEESEGWEWGHGCSRFGLIARGYDAGYFAYPL
jgi:metallopeptidase MepB